MRKVKIAEEKDQKYYAIRTHKEVFNQYVRISNETFIPMCKLAEIALPLLKRKLKIKDEVSNGGSGL